MSKKQKKSSKDDSDGINEDIGEVSAPTGDESLMKLIRNGKKHAEAKAQKQPLRKGQLFPKTGIKREVYRQSKQKKLCDMSCFTDQKVNGFGAREQKFICISCGEKRGKQPGKK